MKLELSVSLLFFGIISKAFKIPECSELFRDLKHVQYYDVSYSSHSRNSYKCEFQFNLLNIFCFSTLKTRPLYWRLQLVSISREYRCQRFYIDVSIRGTTSNF